MPPSDTMSPRLDSMDAGLNRQNSDLRNHGSNHFRRRLTCAIDMLIEKLSVLLTTSDCVVDPDPVAPIFNDPQPTPPPAAHFVLLLLLSSSTFLSESA